MNVHSLYPLIMPTLTASPSADRRQQILAAAMVCFAKRGFHQTSMHDISAEAGISVGLIYRYFENKEAVISAMAAEHKQEIRGIARPRPPGALIARSAGGLLYRPLLRGWRMPRSNPPLSSIFLRKVPATPASPGSLGIFSMRWSMGWRN